MLREGFTDKLLVIRQGGHFVEIFFHTGLHTETFLCQIGELAEEDLGEFSRGNGAPKGGKADLNPCLDSVFSDVHGGGFQNFLAYPAGCHHAAFSGTFRGPAVTVSQGAVQTAKQIILHSNPAVPVFKINGGNISLIPVYDPHP